MEAHQGGNESEKNLEVSDPNKIIDLGSNTEDQKELEDDSDQSQSDEMKKKDGTDEDENVSEHDVSEDESSTSGEGSSESSDNVDHGFTYVKMPFLKYGRIAESLRAQRSSSVAEAKGEGEQVEPLAPPLDVRPLATACRCSALGQVVMKPGQNFDFAGLSLGLSTSLSDATNDLLQLPKTTSNANNNENRKGNFIQSKIMRFPVLAMAMEDGSIHLLNAKTGEAICPSNELKIYTNQNTTTRKPVIAAMSFDSGANYLAAVTIDGQVAVFELKYGIGEKIHVSVGASGSTNSPESATEERAVAPTESTNANAIFNSFLSRLAGDDRGDTSASQKKSSTEPSAVEGSSRDSNTLDVSTNNATSLSSPGIVLYLTQPVSTARFSYGKERGDGTQATCLAIDPCYSKMREKSILVGFSNGRLIRTQRSGFGGVTTNDNGFGGMMGSLLQPKRQDTDLYQAAGGDGIEAIAWRGQLVAWADHNGIKIMRIDKLSRIARIDRPSGARASLYPHISSLHPTLRFERSDSLLICWGDCLMTMEIKGKKVKATMAWELDCVGCDVQPIDADNVAVLGLSSIGSQDDGVDGEGSDLGKQYSVELQMINRADGSVSASDILPLAVSQKTSNEKPSSEDFKLHSSFSTARMEDTFEAENEEEVDEVSSIDINMILKETMASSINEKRPTKKFTDHFMQWSVESYRRAVIDECFEDDWEEEDSVESDDSEDYGFLFRPSKGNTYPLELLTNVPCMVVRSRDDVVLTQVRDIDDSIEYARKNKHLGLALRHGLHYRQMLRRNNLDDLIDDYLTAILNPSETIDDYESPRSLSIRRLTMAAKSMPILIGGKIHLWERWSKEFSRIPGGLLLLRPYLPVRDPKLPPHIYEIFLVDMFSEIEEMILNRNVEGESPTTSYLHENAVDLLLAGLRAWGAMSSIRDRLKLHRNTMKKGIGGNEQIRLYHEAESAFSARMHQSSADYLLIGANSSNPDSSDPSSVMIPSGVTGDSLFDPKYIEKIFKEKILESGKNCTVKSCILEIMAELSMMEGLYSKSLEIYVKLGAEKLTEKISLIENLAIKSVFRPKSKYVDPAYHDRYKHVLTLVEINELHTILLGTRSGGTTPPLVAFICLVGLRDAGQFIIDNCVLPDTEDAVSSPNTMAFPLDQVASQFEHYPKLLLWFLHSIISCKPEIYVKFPNTAVPSPAVTKLHQTHFDLYVKFVERKSKVVKKLSQIPSFEEIHKESTLLKFLKAALPHGGIRSEDVRSTLERCRMSDKDPPKKKGSALSIQKAEHPHLFAHELAFVIERSGAVTEELSNQVLILYLEGVVSLPLAVEYAERNVRHSSMLWDNLVSYCLSKEAHGRKSNGKIFGSLLEVAARSGADLSKLVSKIPKKMSIDGIRSKLVAAISDYQIKVQMHRAAYEVLSCDKVTLLRQQYYRSRRGNRIDLNAASQDITWEDKAEEEKQNVKISLKPWKEGKERLASKRKERKSRKARRKNIGIDLPRSLEIT